MNTDKHRSEKDSRAILPRNRILFSSVFICVHLWLIFLLSCSSHPVDLRTLVPSETLVYLETNDLAAALQPMVASEAFKKAAASQPDLSSVKGVAVAIAVTGFETSEQKLTDEDSVGQIQPKFVAVADTKAWNSTAVAFAEKGLGSFVADVYRTEPALEKLPKHGGTYLKWSVKDGRKAFALVIESVIYFSNDESAIDKCVAVRRGESDSMAKSGKLPQRVPNSLASGYITPDGVAQIAALAGMSFASQSSDDEEVQSAVAGILPQLIRGTVTDIAWNASQSQQGYEDKLVFGANAETGPVLAEVFAASQKVDDALFQYAWGKAPSITLYDLAKPNVAWRGLLLTSQSKVDAFGSRVIGEFSNAFAEPYGVSDAELFLFGVGPNILTVRTDAEGEKAALIAVVTNADAVRRSLLKELKADKATSDALGFEVLKDEDAMAVFAGNIIITGDPDAVEACLRSKSGGTSLAASPSLMSQFRSGASAITLSTESDQAAAVADLLSEKNTDPKANTIAITETRFTRTAIERRTTSDLGMIGWLLEKISAE
jgi:hypothetical protein